MSDNNDVEKLIQEVVESPRLQTQIYFPTLVYTIKALEFIDQIRLVSEESLSKRREELTLNELYPVYMSDNLFDNRIEDFIKYTAQTAWNILSEQGYDMMRFTTNFESLWVQEHYKHSAMEQHIHTNGVQMVGFYFLDTPEDCSRLAFHDPRSGRIQIQLPEVNLFDLTTASVAVNIKPEAGLLVFAPAWLPHSFTRHGSDEAIRFAHFNIIVNPVPQMSCNTSAEIV